MQVLLLEKARLPRYKACGGGLTLKGLRALPFDVHAAVEAVVEGGILAYRGQEILRARLPQPIAWMVMRARFDQLLVERAVQAGAQLVEGAALTSMEQDAGGVSVQAGRNRFRAQLLAGADGVHSVVARFAGLMARREVGIAIEQEMAASEQAMAAQGRFIRLDFGALPGGYGWIFPKREQLSVGVFHAQAGKAPHLRERLADFVARQRVLHTQGHPVPLGGRREPLHNGRVLLVGDAANLADAWLGEGIAYAIASAGVAARVMQAALDGPDLDLSGYTQEMQRSLVRQLRHAGYIAAIVYRAPRLASTLLARNPTVQQAVLAALCGDRSLRRLNYWLVLHAPGIFWRTMTGKNVPAASPRV